MALPSKPLSRKDFLRIATLAGLALPGCASALGQEDLPEELASEGKAKRPWWVKEVDQPTVEIDWLRKRRYDASQSLDGGGRNFQNFVGEEIKSAVEATRTQEIRRRINEQVPGYTLKDFSLMEAQRSGVMDGGTFLGPPDSPSPQDFGVSAWNPQPREAARVLRVAMRHFGAAQVGFLRLDQNTRKLIYAVDRDGKEIRFEDVAKAYETETKRVIPYGVEWVITYTVRMSTETVKRAPTVISGQTHMLSYARGRFIQAKTQAFLRGLGYQALGQAPLNGLGLPIGFAVLSGLGELSRQNRLITPEYGPMVRTFFMLTDLPLATDKPIDAGVARFCQTCKKCAEACPVSALSYDDLPRWETRGVWNSGGHRAYYEDSVSCMRYWREVALSDCGICFAVCPFSKKDKAWLHDLVKAGIASAPVLDEFLRSMDDAFSYGASKNPEDWWHQDLPEYGLE